MRRRTQHGGFRTSQDEEERRASQVTQVVKNPPANAGDAGDGSGRSPGVGIGNPLQNTCLENSMDRGVWQDTVHRVTNSQTQLNTHPHCTRTGRMPEYLKNLNLNV